jgi:hypothetical protein
MAVFSGKHRIYEQETISQKEGFVNPPLDALIKLNEKTVREPKNRQTVFSKKCLTVFLQK